MLRTPQYHPERQPSEPCWGIVKHHMADPGDCTTHNLHHQWPLALAKVQPSTWSKLSAKVVAQAEKYWAEEVQLYEDDFDAMAEEEWAAD
jgi:hypothetical protein